jgi:hypothetical protein
MCGARCCEDQLVAAPRPHIVSAASSRKPSEAPSSAPAAAAGPEPSGAFATCMGGSCLARGSVGNKSCQAPRASARQAPQESVDRVQCVHLVEVREQFLLRTNATACTSGQLLQPQRVHAKPNSHGQPSQIPRASTVWPVVTSVQHARETPCAQTRAMMVRASHAPNSSAAVILSLMPS